MFYAHILNKIDGSQKYQTVADHCRQTAEIAADCVEHIGLRNTAFLAGILHDIGKYKNDFQDYLSKAANGDNVKRGSVIHTFTGVQYVLGKYHTDNRDEFEHITAEIIAYAIGAHHGLFDLDNGNPEGGFDHRRYEDENSFEECVKNYLSSCMSESEIDHYFSLAVEEISEVIESIKEKTSDDEDADRAYTEIYFNLSLLIRLVLSAVIEGDRTDTSLFMSESILSLPKKVSWGKYLKNVELKLDGLIADSKIGAARRELSDRCRLFANHDNKVIRLNLPTGGGKTLSSLRYALACAEKFHKDRIIFTIPLLSILEQNAKVIREYIQDNSIILEHHSNVINSDDGEDNGEREAAIESWDSPIVVTTLVQLLDTMFSGKTACIRRFHALQNAVIVVDEVQTVPVKMLALFNLAISFITTICNSTVVLCSATQPPLDMTEYPISPKPKDMVPFDAKLWEVFKRTDILDGGSCSLESVPTYSLELLKDRKSLLIVCNTKKEAEILYQEISNKGMDCFHLSASMCMAHRRKVIQDIYDALDHADTAHPVICVSTQVIEAGVDISFDSVIRLAAGMDSVVQAAGRCNRNGETINSPVVVLNITNEKLNRLIDINRGKNATIELLYNYKNNSEMFLSDLTSDIAIKEYYRILYRDLPKKSMDYPVKDPECTLLDLLSVNYKYSRGQTYVFHYAFALAGKLFNVFEDDSIDVIVPYGRGADIIKELNGCDNRDFKKKTGLIREAKQYAVSVYSHQQKILEQEMGIHWICDGSIAVLAEEYYDKDTGLSLGKQEMAYMEV